MTKTPVKLIRAVEAYMDFLAHQKSVKQTVHQVHEAAGQLEAAIKSQSGPSIAEEEKLLAQQEKQLHLQVHELERSLSGYQKLLRAASTGFKRSARVTLHGRVYQILRKGTEIDIKMI